MFRRHGSRSGAGFRAVALMLVLLVGCGLYSSGWVGPRVAYAHDNVNRRLDTEGDVGSYNSLVLDASGNPVVSYYDFTKGDLKLARCTDHICEGDVIIVTLDSDGDVGLSTSLALDDEGKPVVSYYAFAPYYGLKLVRCVHVSCTNAAPVAEDDAYTVTAGGVLAVDAGQGVLANDFDPDPEDADLLTVRLVSDVEHGTLVLNTADGSFTYTPHAGFAGADQFSYAVSDGGLEAGAVVPITVQAVVGRVVADLHRPILTDVQPNTGPATGGTRVTLSGERLAGATAVRFGASPALRFTILSGEEIVALAPPGTGTVEVRVTGPGVTSSTSPEALRFTYLPQPAASFPDLSSDHWAYAGVQLLAELGALGGFADGTFRSDAVVTRAEFVKLLLGVLGLEPAAGRAAGDPSFQDVPPSAWHAPYVTTAVREGFVQGTSPSTFSPDAPLTREQLAVLLARALQLPDGGGLPFVDADRISPWARPGVSAAVAAGYLEGFLDGTFRPQAPATRAQAAAVLAQVLLRSGDR